MNTLTMKMWMTSHSRHSQTPTRRPRKRCSNAPTLLIGLSAAAINSIFGALQETRVDISGKVTSISTGSTGTSSSSSSSSTATGDDASPYDNYDSYGNYETYYDETTSSPGKDTSGRVTVSTGAGAELDLGVGGKIELEAGTGTHISTSGVGTSVTINRNKTKLVSETVASSSSPA